MDLERPQRWTPAWIIFTAILSVVAIAAGLEGYRWLGVPVDDGHSINKADFVDIRDVPLAPPPPAVQPTGSAGTWRVDCGRNEEGQHNSDNVVMTPGVPGGAEHAHDYVGNVSTNAFSTDQSLAAAGTTCKADDKSTYFWPVLLVPEGSDPSGHGRIVVPDSVLIEYQGNPLSNVVPMPRFLRAASGNPHGLTQNGANTEHVQWTCSGERDRTGRQYPLCPSGQQVVRVFDFPSCWNGRTTDSPNHRSHLTYPDAAGACAPGTFPVPRLHIELTYTVPPGDSYVVDSFPEENHSPITDHSDYIDVMPDAVMNTVVQCINSGQHCSA